MKKNDSPLLVILLMFLPILLRAQTDTEVIDTITVFPGTINGYSSPSAVWYKYTATQDARTEITTCGFAYPTYLSIYESTNLADSIEIYHISCDKSDIDHDKAYFYAIANKTYYFYWRNPLAGVFITFSWSITEATLSPGEICSTANPLVIGSNNTGGNYVRWYSYSPQNDAEKIDIRSCGPHPFYSQIRFGCGSNDYERSAKHIKCEASTTTQFEALPGTNYYLKVYPTLSKTFTATKSTPVMGEICSNPYTAVEGINTANHSVNTDQWYLYTPSKDGIIRLDNIDLTNSHELHIYPTCGAAVQSINKISIHVYQQKPIYILIRNRDSQIYDWTLTFSVKSGFANIALNKQVLASSKKDDQGEASNANDGMMTTRWNSASSDPQWLSIDLGISYNIIQTVINWDETYAKAYRIETSDNNTDWAIAKDVNDGTGDTEIFDFTNLTARYVRIYCNSRNTNAGYAIKEFELYGSLVTNTTRLTPTGSEAEISIYPNPFSSALNIYFYQEDDFQKAILFDLTGKKLNQWIISSYESNFHKDLTQLPSGIYLIRLIGEHNTKTFRIIKQ